MSMAQKSLPPFHLAFPVDDLAKAETFYCGVFGCPTGRRSDAWIDFDFFGHQIVAHLVGDPEKIPTNQVDGKQVPVRHFGIVVTKKHWLDLIDQLQSASIDFLIQPNTRFHNQPGEQGTFFVQDPAGNALEFKYFDNSEALFAK